MTNGFLTPLHDADGKVRGWRLRWRDVAGKNRSRTFERNQKALADKALAQVRVQANSAIVGRTRGDVTVGWFIKNEWQPRQSGHAAKTRETQEALVRTWVEPKLAKRPLRQVSVAEAESAITAVLTAGRARATAIKVRSIMSSIWAEAVRLDYSDRNVIRDTKLPRAGNDDDGDDELTDDPLTPAQIAALLAAADATLRPLVLLGAACGLRPGESAAVRVRDIDANAGTLTVAGSISTAPKRFQGGASQARKRPKNVTSRRTIRIPSVVLTELAQLGEGRNRDAPLVVSRSGTPVRWDNVRDRQWARAIAAAGIDARYTPHDLRHYCASQLISTGVPLTAVAKYLGHATPNETLRTYARLLDEDSGVAAAALEAVWSTP